MSDRLRRARPRRLAPDLRRHHRQRPIPLGGQDHDHIDVVAPNLSAMFDFFDRHRKRAGTN